MRTIILAAGSGSRLQPLTADRPKCLVSLAGHPLLAYQLAALREAGIAQVGMVTGYQADRLAPWVQQQWHNQAYESTNMVHSLMCAREWLDGDEDVLITYADIVYEARLVRCCMESRAPLATIVDRAWSELWDQRFDDPLSDAETLALSDAGTITDLGRRPTSMASIDGQYIGMIRVGATFAPQLVDHYESLGTDGAMAGTSRETMYMTDFLRSLVMAGIPLTGLSVKRGWLEVDTLRDLATYEQMHAAKTLGRFCCLPDPRLTEACG